MGAVNRKARFDVAGEVAGVADRESVEDVVRVDFSEVLATLEVTEPSLGEPASDIIPWPVSMAALS